MAALGKLSKLRRLAIEHCEQITPAGFEIIARLSELEALGLLNAHKLNDNNLNSLAGCRQLKSLFFWITPEITDKGLNHISRLPLAKLWISGCERITSEGIQAFRRAHPYCDVDIKPDWKPNSPSLPPPIRK